LNRHQGTKVEATVVQKFNQGECTAVLYPPPCLSVDRPLELFGTFSFKRKSTERNVSEIVLYFFVLTQKSIKKSQETIDIQHDCFIRPD